MKARAVQMTATVLKVAAGAAETTPIAVVTNLARTLRLLKDAGLWIVGADAEAHDVAVGLDCDVVIHPPLEASQRAFKSSATIRRPKAFLIRNKEIVKATECLIAAPAEAVEQLRSGTWSTVRYARRLHRRIFILLPDGTIKAENSQ